jgi:glycosyltransferase involved in cell wall biosynthesis
MIDRQQPNFLDAPGRRALPRNYRRGTSPCDHVDVTVVTPYYNTKEFFVETFVSMLAQSLQNWEWIIVDDGSPDTDAVARLAEFAAQDARITVVRQPNGGTAVARNTGFRHSKGRYICLLDHDDELEPTYLEKCAWFLDSNLEFAFCNSYTVIFDEQEFLWTTGYEREREFLKANSGPPISVVRRTAYEECGGFDETIRVLYEDWDFWLAMAKVGHWGYTIPEYLQWYRKLGSGRYEQILQSGYVNEEFAKGMQQKYAGLDRHFPSPVRRVSKRYDCIETEWQACNPLAANPDGRRIMLIVPWMVMGGADRVNLDLVEGLTALGHDVTVCATLLADHSWEHQFTRFTPDVFVLPNILRESDYPRFLAYLIESRQIDTVVVSGSTVGYQLLPYLRSVAPGVAFLDLCHVEEPHWLNGGHPRFGVGYQDVLDLNVVTTAHLADWMAGRGADESRIRVMYTGVRADQESVSADAGSSLREELGLPADIPVIVFSGRMCEQKRPLLLAEILKAARDAGLKFRAVVLGDGAQKQEFESLLKHYRLMDVVLTLGSVSHQRWLDILAISDILLLPSQYEGISIALLEAIAAGVVPVVSDVGGQKEIVSPDAGILIGHGGDEVQQYVAALRTLLSDPAQLQQMSNQCRLLSDSKLSWRGMIEKFASLLDEAHRLKVSSPRCPISQGFGRELASQSLPDVAAGLPFVGVPAARIPLLVRLAIRLRQTRLGEILIRNRLLKSLGVRMVKKLMGSASA